MFSVFLSAVRRHLGREANTSGVRQARVQQQPHIHQHLYGDYLGAVEKAQWGEGGGAGALRGIRCGFRRMIEASLWESLARSGPRAPAPTPQSVEVIQWGYSVTTMRKERGHGSTVTLLGGEIHSENLRRFPPAALAQQARTSTEIKASG